MMCYTLLQEGEIPLEDLLVRYGYGVGGPSGVRSGDSDSGEGGDSGDSVRDEDSSDEATEEPNNDPTVNDTPADSPHTQETGQTSSSSSDQRLPTSNSIKPKIKQSAPIQDITSTTDQLPSVADTPGPSVDKPNVSNHSEKETGKEGKRSLLGKRQGEAPVINDVLLGSKHPALMKETDEGS